jgi:hypothetical protein
VLLLLTIFAFPLASRANPASIDAAAVTSGDVIVLSSDLLIEEDETFAVPPGAVLLIGEGVILANFGTIENRGLIDNDGLIENHGTLLNIDEGYIDNEDGQIATYDDGADEIDDVTAAPVVPAYSPPVSKPTAAAASVRRRTAASPPVISSDTPRVVTVDKPSNSYPLSADGTPPITWSASGDSGDGILAPAADAPTIINPTSLPSGTVEGMYYARINATGTSPMTWRVSGGSLPPGLVLERLSDDHGVVIGGTPTEAGSFGFTVMVSNDVGSDDAMLSITITSPLEAPHITTDSLPDGTFKGRYSQVLAATGGDVTWELVEGNLPEGISLSPGGSLSGTPTDIGEFKFTVSARNSVGVDTKDLSVGVYNCGQLGCQTGGSAAMAWVLAVWVGKHRGVRRRRKGQ